MNTNYSQKEGDNIYEYLKRKISLEEVARKLGIELTPKGDEKVGMCPSGHPSKSRTSFSINNKKQLFFCYSCKAGGSSIELVSLALGIKPAEVLNWFKKEFNLGADFDLLRKGYREKTDDEKQKEQDIKTRDFLLEKVVEIGKKLLYEPKGEETLKYLINDRKYELEKLKETEFMYFPKSYVLKEYLYEEYSEIISFLFELFVIEF